jgi:hypothetical protein
MSWLKSLFGRGTRTPVDLGWPPEVEAFYEELYQFMQDEDAQNARLPEPLRAMVAAAPKCDEIPGARGEFGRIFSNPIPVNGPIGELIYLTNLQSRSGQFLLFHRLGSIKNVDIYETVGMDASGWDIMFLNFYYPGKSLRAPKGYRVATGRDRQHAFSGTNTLVEGFPTDLHKAITATNEQLGLPFGAPLVRFALERTTFMRPPGHAAAVKVILEQLGGQSVLRSDRGRS